MSKDAGNALPVLEKLAEAKDADDRLSAVAAMGVMASETRAVERLGGLLKNKDADLRREAACALTERGAAVAQVLPALEDGLSDRDAGVRWWCALALAGSEIDVRKYEEDILHVLRAAVLRVGDHEPWKVIQEVYASTSTRAVPAWVEVLRNRPAPASGGCPVAGSGGPRHPDGLASAARSAEGRGQGGSPGFGRSAGARGDGGDSGAHSLARQCGWSGTRSAARAPGLMGLPVRLALEPLLRLAKDTDSAVRTQVALALWRIDQQADVALPILKQVIQDVDNTNRWEAIEAMGIIFVEAQPSIRGLTELVVNALKDRDTLVRTHAAKWMFRRERQPRVVVPLLRDGVTDRDVQVRLASVEVLGEMGAEARVAPLLLTALEDRDLSVRLAAEEALAQGGAEAVPQLIESLKSKRAKVRLGVIRALGLMGPAAKEATSVLEKLQGDGDAAVRKAARLRLGRSRRVGRDEEKNDAVARRARSRKRQTGSPLAASRSLAARGFASLMPRHALPRASSPRR